MTNLQQIVWKAIEEELIRWGDSDILAGIAWLNDDMRANIAQAAIDVISKNWWDETNGGEEQGTEAGTEQEEGP